MATRETNHNMNVQDQDTPNPNAEAAQQLWEQIEREEAGLAPRHVELDPAPNNQHTQAAPAHKADAQGDEVAVVPEQTLLDEVAGLKSMLTQATQRLRNAEGHIGGLNNQLKQISQQQSTKAADAPTAKEIRDAQGDPEAMQTLKRDYPEFATAMESVLNERFGALEQRIQAQPAQQVQVQAGVTAEDLARMQTNFQVEVRHPGWQDRVQTAEFQGWLGRQSREVQMLAASESPQDAVRLLDIHSETTRSAVTTQKTQRLNSAAALPSGRSAGASPRQKSLDEMTTKELWAYYDEQDRIKR